jgi:hypothetical protein
MSDKINAAIRTSPLRDPGCVCTSMWRAMSGAQMIRRFACAIAAMASFALNGAIGQAPVGSNLRGNDTNQTSPNVERRPAPTKSPDLRETPLGGNPLWGIPMSSLSAMRERPLFSASRRPSPPPRPVVETPPSPSAEPEHPPFTLVGTAIGKTQNVAVILDPTTKNLVRLHSGEAASLWNLRSVDLRSMTVAKHNQAVALSLSATGAKGLNGRAYDPNSDLLPMSSGATPPAAHPPSPSIPHRSPMLAERRSQ